jgi:hypothetical protein
MAKTYADLLDAMHIAFEAYKAGHNFERRQPRAGGEAWEGKLRVRCEVAGGGQPGL